MNLVIGLILVLSLTAIFLFFRSTEILSVAKKRISDSFEDGNNNYNALSGVIFLVISFVAIIWYSYDQFDNYFLPIREILFNSKGLSLVGIIIAKSSELNL